MTFQALWKYALLLQKGRLLGKDIKGILKNAPYISQEISIQYLQVRL